MYYGSGAFLAALGLILALAVNDKVPNVNLGLIGWILFGCGVVLAVLGFITANRRGTTVVERDERL